MINLPDAKPGAEVQVGNMKIPSRQSAPEIEEI